MADFENGLRKAIINIYPYAILNGCWYHFTAAVRRKILSFKLYKLIEEQPVVHFIYRSILSLPLLPPDAVLKGYNIIKQKAKASEFYKALKPVFDYFESFWLGLVRQHFNL